MRLASYTAYCAHCFYVFSMYFIGVSGLRVFPLLINGNGNGTAEHDVVWSIWAGDCGELSCAHLNREWKFHTKYHELIGVFLACPPDWAQVLHCYAPNAVYRCVVANLPDNCTRLEDSLKQTVGAFKFSTLLGKFVEQPSCTIPLWQIDIYNQNPIFLWNFHDFI